MSRWFAGVIVVSSIVVGTSAYAQETPGPGKLEVTLIPAGFTFFTSDGPEPSFRNYQIGAAVEYNFTKAIGVEGEFGGSIGMKQNLVGFIDKMNTPDMFSYTANLVAAMPGHSVVPYVTGGFGGLSVYDSRDLGIDSNIGQFWTGNVGGGVKWYQSSGRWGLRGDYRYEITQSKDTAPLFFGQNGRHGNRIYGGVIINAVK
jgi:hypothetical protein